MCMHVYVYIVCVCVALCVFIYILHKQICKALWPNSPDFRPNYCKCVDHALRHFGRIKGGFGCVSLARSGAQKGACKVAPGHT